MTKKLLLIILLVAAFLRLYKLGEVPATMYVDEVAIGVDAKSIAQTGKDMHGYSIFTPMFPSYGDYKLPTYVWLAAASVKVIGATQFAVRLPSALAGIATVWLVYAVVLELFSEQKRKQYIALCSAALVALLPWSILFSRTAFEGHIGQAFVLTAVLFALKARTNPKWYLAMGVAAALAVYSYFSVRFVAPVILAATVLCWTNTKNLKHKVGWILVAVMICAVAMVPLFTTKYYAPSEKLRLSTKNVLSSDQPWEYAKELRDQEGNSIISKVLHRRDFYILKNLARNVFTHLDFGYLFLHGDENLRHSTGKVGILLLAFAPFLLAGIYTLAKKYPRVGLFLLIWYGIALVPASVPSEVPHALRSLNGLGALSIVCGLGAYELFSWLLHKNRLRVGRFIALGLLTAVILNFSAFMYDYHTHYNNRSYLAWYLQWRHLVDLVEPNTHNDMHIYVSGPDRHLFLWFLFYGNFDFHEIQKAQWDDYKLTEIDEIKFMPQAEMSEAMDEANSMFVGLNEEAPSKSMQIMHPEYGFDIRYILNK